MLLLAFRADDKRCIRVFLSGWGAADGVCGSGPCDLYIIPN